MIAKSRFCPTQTRCRSTRVGILLLLACGVALFAGPAANPPQFLSPTAIATAPDGRVLYVACATGDRIAVVDPIARKMIRTIAVDAQPLGLTVSRDGQTLVVACAGPPGTLCIINAGEGTVRKRMPADHTAMAPVFSRDGKTLFVCYRFDNAVGIIDVDQAKEKERIAVLREPVACALTSDGQYLLVANHIHAGRSDVEVVASNVTVIDVAADKVFKEIKLPNGATLLRDLRVSPDGRYAVVTHLLARFHLPTSQIERGWINSNALSVIDLADFHLLNTVLLDEIDSGAANPWAAAWAQDGQSLCVTHAGTHEVSVINFPGLISKLTQIASPSPSDRSAREDPFASSANAVQNDLAFLYGLRRRIKLPPHDRGPRAVVLLGDEAWIANYFSDSLTVLDLACEPGPVQSLVLAPPRPMTLGRRGEFFFNDAGICFQGWQSCASCHSSDARVDGLNWDNLNDGIGNPKNVKSLLLAHATPPSMWLGVRANASVAVRAGIRSSLFTIQPEETAAAIDEYLKSLRPIPSPHLVRGKLSPAAERGKDLFEDESIGCSECHAGRLLTDQKLHDVGTAGKFDQRSDRFDTPSLVEVWRTAPYLHDGRAVSIREVITTFNRNDRHGHTSQLTPSEIQDLIAYVLSL